MKNLNCNQIKIFINLEIIGEKKLYTYFYNLKKILQFSKAPWYNQSIIASKPNFYDIV